MSEAAEVLEQVAVEAEVRAQHLGDTQREVPVRNREQDRLGEQGAEKLHLLLVAGRAEPAAFAGERQQVLVLAVVAPDAGEATRQIAAVQELVNDLRDDWAQEPVTGLIVLLIAGEKRIEVPGQALPERRGLRLAGTIDLLHHAAQCIEEGVSSNGIPKKKVWRK